MTIPDKLAKAIKRFRDADHEAALSVANEEMIEAAGEFAQQFAEEAIQKCAKIARGRGAADAADDMLALLEM